jgi:hypothetical protein
MTNKKFITSIIYEPNFVCAFRNILLERLTIILSGGPSVVHCAYAKIACIDMKKESAGETGITRTKFTTSKHSYVLRILRDVRLLTFVVFFWPMTAKKRRFSNSLTILVVLLVARG